MKILSTTLERKDLFGSYKEKGVNEIIVALENNTFSALHEMKEEDIQELTEQCHENDMTITVLMNRLYSEADIYEAQKTMERVLLLGVDGLMFADPGLLRYAKQKGLESHLIYRPETLMTCSKDALFWIQEGLRSVVIPCLLTKNEVIEIARDTNDTTVIIHGSTLMSVSKRKLLSAYQHVTNQSFDVSSRTLALKEKQREDHMPAYENAYSMMIYTDYVQESFEEMDEFMNAGVKYFEIDTTFMDDGSILDAIEIYRMILDGKDASQMIETYKQTYQDLHLSDGYYGQKTVK